MKQRILIYGDSNVWGYGVDGGRLPLGDRWPTILQEEIGNDYEVIANGESGRIAGDFEDPAGPLNGPPSFKMEVKKAMPLDVVIVALGTNDLKRKYRQTAQQLVANLLWYQAAMYDLFSNDSHSPSLLYVLPPNFAYREGGMSDEVRREVIELMEQSVGVERCVVAHDLDLSEDGLHLSPRGHVQLAGMVVRTYLSN